MGGASRRRVVDETHEAATILGGEAQLTARVRVAHRVRVGAAVRLGPAPHSAHVLTDLYEAPRATVRALVLGLLVGAGIRFELSLSLGLWLRARARARAQGSGLGLGLGSGLGLSTSAIGGSSAAAKSPHPPYASGATNTSLDT